VAKTRPTWKQYARRLPFAVLPVGIGAGIGYAIGSATWVVALTIAGAVMGIGQVAVGIGISRWSWRSYERSHNGR